MYGMNNAKIFCEFIVHYEFYIHVLKVTELGRNMLPQ